MNTMDFMPGQPGQIVVAGDWHRSTRWGRSVIELLPELLPGEDTRIVVHLGDFGVWPGGAGTWYIRNLSRALAAVGGLLLFIDGNHEWHPELRELYKQAQASRYFDGSVPLTRNVIWLPRGLRWQWGDRTWLAMGGAVSVDRARRTPAVDWWPEEAITEADARRAVHGGPAEVMLTHDCPAGVPLTLPPPHSTWAASDLARAAEHRELLAEITCQVQPRHILHGHYHLFHRTDTDLGYGPVQVTGLDRDGAVFGNFGVLDVRDMSWHPPVLP